jgi:hypothetical protein
MIDRTALTRIAKSVAAELTSGHLSAATPRSLEGLDGHPEHVFDLIDLMAKEGLKKRPSDKLIGGYAFILGHSLEMLRYAVDRDDRAIIALVEQLRNHLLEAGNEGLIRPAILMLVLHQFASAKLEIGDALRELLHRLMENDDEARAACERGEGADHFARVAVDMDNDPFAIHAYLDESMESLPQEMRSGLVMATFGANVPAVREASLGFLLSKSGEARQKLAELLELAAPHNLISPTMLRRMIALRNWLPATDREGLDKAIKAARKNAVACAPAPYPQVLGVLASGVDGSGALTVLVVAKDGRKSAVAGLLVKHGFGVRDAWVRRSLTERDLQEILAHVGSEIDIAPSSLDYVMAVARQALAINLATGNMPPFGMLDFAEAVGLANFNPETLPVDTLVANLVAEIDPARLSAAAIARTLRESADWPDKYPMLTTWFEDNMAEVVGTKRAPRAKQIAALLAGPLQARRRRWAELAAWTALSLKHQAGDTDWQSFAVLARELLGTRPVDEIGLMKVIAHTSLEVLSMQGLLGARRVA